MWGWVLAAVGAWAFCRPRSPPARSPVGAGRESGFTALAEGLRGEIEECVRTINRTSCAEVGVRCFQTIRENARRLFESAPPGRTVTLFVNDETIESAADLPAVDAAREAWVEEFFRERIEAAMRGADLLTDPALKASQLRKALDLALEAAEYAPDALAATERVREIEGKLVAQTAPAP